MTKVLVTGGAGALGREVVRKLIERGYTARIMSRGHSPAHLLPGTEWAQANLETGQGLSEAVCGIDVMVHAATSPFKHTHRVDVDGTQLLLEQARTANVSHVIYISIVGIDRIPYPYYQCKLTAEERIKHAGIPWSILRSTQFHSLFGRLLQSEITWPLPIVLPTDFLSQPVADSEVANRLADLVAAGPGGHLPDIGGPEVLNWGDIARTWLRLRGIDRVLIHLPLPGKAAYGFRQGYNTCPHCPEDRRGKITWAEWVRRQYQDQ